MIGAGGYYAGVAGAVTVEIIAPDTLASIGPLADVNADTSGANADQDVNVSAVNDCEILAIDGPIAGAGYGSLSGGFPQNDVWFTTDNPTSQTTAARVWQSYR